MADVEGLRQMRLSVKALVVRYTSCWNSIVNSQREQPMHHRLAGAVALTYSD
jgi:hypothetical protein